MLGYVTVCDMLDALLCGAHGDKMYYPLYSGTRRTLAGRPPRRMPMRVERMRRVAGDRDAQRPLSKQFQQCIHATYT